MKKIILILATLCTLGASAQMATVYQQTVNGVKMDTIAARDLSIKKHLDSIRVLTRTLNTRILTVNNSIATNSAIAVTGGATAVKQDSSLARELSIKKHLDSIRVLTRTLNTRILTVNNSIATNSAIAVSGGSVQAKAGENHIGQVGYNATNIINTITTSTTAYSSGDNIGGIISATAAIRVSGGTAMLTDLTVWDKENQKPALTIDFWSASPSGGTYTDNAAEVIAGDQSRYLGSVSVASADYVTTGVVARANIKNIQSMLKASDTTIFYTITTSSTPTYSTTSSVFVGLGIKQD